MKEQKGRVDFNKLKSRLGTAEITFGGVLPSNGSTALNKTGGWKSMRPVTDHSRCIACGMCWSVCPEGCIYVREEDGRFQSNYDYCKGCGICPTVCPVKCITMVIEEK